MPKEPEHEFFVRRYTGGLYDRDGRRLSNDANAAPAGESSFEKGQRERSQAYQRAKIDGTLGQWYQQNDAEHTPASYLNEHDRDMMFGRSRGRGRERE